MFEVYVAAKALVDMLECVIKLWVSSEVVICQSLGGGGQADVEIGAVVSGSY